MDWLWYIGLFFFAAMTEVCNAAYVHFIARSHRSGAVFFSGAATIVRGLLVLAFVYDHMLLPLVAAGDMVGTYASLTFFRKRQPRKNESIVVDSFSERKKFPARKSGAYKERSKQDADRTDLYYGG